MFGGRGRCYPALGPLRLFCVAPFGFSPTTLRRIGYQSPSLRPRPLTALRRQGRRPLTFYLRLADDY